MITKEQLAAMSHDEVYALFMEKKRQCRTCAQEVEMIIYDTEYNIIKERLCEFPHVFRKKGEQK